MHIYKNNYKQSTLVFTILIVFLLLCTSLSVSAINLSYNDENQNTNKNNEYIIQFNEDPIFTFKNKLRENSKEILSDTVEKILNKVFNQNTIIYKNKIIALHYRAKKDILKILGDEANLNEVFSKDFFMLFNGISVKNIPYNTVNEIKELPYVKDVIPNIKISAALDESAPLINADDVWKMNDSYGRNITGKGITMAILDTGVDYTHPDLIDNYISDGSYDFVNNDTDPMDDHFKSHGTHCAGIACGKGIDSNYQYVGIAPDAKFYAYKILDENGTGDNEAFFAGFEAAIDPNGDLDASDHVDIISISFGTHTPGSPDDVLSQMADDAVEAGIVVVAAAGNQGPFAKTISSPGCAINVICVGSSTKDDKISGSSSRGPVEWNGTYMIKPDIVAPGVNIMSTNIGGGYISMSGTSMAVPHVCGAAALLLQAKPELKNNPDMVKNILKESATDINYDANTQGSGRLNIAKALDIVNEINIDAPSEVFEESDFNVKITDEEGKPITVLVIVNVPFHIPRVKIGSTLNFNAPTVFLDGKEIIVGEIIVFRLFKFEKSWKKDIIIKNK